MKKASWAAVLVFSFAASAQAYQAWRCDKTHPFREKTDLEQSLSNGHLNVQRDREQQERDNLEAMRLLMEFADRLHKKAHGKDQEKR